MLCSYVTSSFAQETNEKKGWIGLGLGFAIPSTEINGVESGLSLDLVNFGYVFQGQQGLGVAIRWTGNAGIITFNSEINEGSWSIGGFYLGPSYTIKLGSNTRIDFKGLVGNTAVNVSVDDEDTSDNGLGINMGANLRYNFHPKWHMIWSIDHQRSTSISIDDFKASCTTVNFGMGFRF